MKNLLSLFSILVLSFTLSQTAISQQVLTIEPAEPEVGNCYPFGGGFEAGDEMACIYGIYLSECTSLSAFAGRHIGV